MNEQIKHYQDKLDFQWDSADLFEALEMGTHIVVVDTRKEFAYQEEHIPGAISFPHRFMNEQSTQALDRGPVYVCYCDGIGCNGSTRGSLKMTKLGFNVRELMGGLDWWKRDGYATEGKKATSGEFVSCAC
ncbi:rhodanese-like domain-containing protein [Rapidithrix thailandica]|uniref:Rhodanese-like domain-containing protein n=1 Tax=Rapidithrix thailandica TaxID=413964 RepID=A0AAW9S1J4_9BACT